MPRRNRRRPMSEINVVPYIDVMLVMLVIFMITAPLLTQGVNVDLPDTRSSVVPPEAREPLVISIDREGLYYMNVGGRQGEPVDIDTLLNRSAAVIRARPDTPVLVRGDARVDYGAVVTLMAMLQQAGVPKVGLVTEPRGDKGGR